MGLKIGILISGSGSNMLAIIDACLAGKIDGKVVFVGSDNPDAEGLGKAKNYDGITTFVVDYQAIAQKFDRKKMEKLFLTAGIDLEKIFVKSRSIIPKSLGYPDSAFFWLSKRVKAEAELLQFINNIDFDLLVLAGFMRNLTSFFIDRINTDPMKLRIMNIHPAILPAFPGTDGYGDTYRYGCRVGGSTVHFVDYGEDTGPIIGQAAFPISLGMTLSDVKKEGLKWEWDLYPRCIQLFAEGCLQVVNAEQRDGRMRKCVKILPKGGV